MTNKSNPLMDLTPSWHTAAKVIEMFLKDDAPKAVIMGELLRMAKLADQYTLVQERSKTLRKVIEGKE